MAEARSNDLPKAAETGNAAALHEQPTTTRSAGPPPKGAHPLLGRRERRDVELRAYAVRPDGEIIDVRVMDLSHDGCAIATEADLTQGEELKLSVLGRGAVKATVRWLKARKAGLRFELDPSPRAIWPRRAARIPLSAEVFLRRSCKLGYRVKIFDASPFGCKCEFVERPLINENVWVKFDGLQALEAEVCWIEGSDFGVRFLKPIHLAVFDMLLERLAPGS